MITKEQVKEAMEIAYKKAGNNAYFENGFEAGVNFAIEVLTKPDIQVECKKSPNGKHHYVMSADTFELPYCKYCYKER